MELLNRIYKGFENEEEVFKFLKDLNYKKESVLRVVKFKGEFYIVGIDLENKFIAGKELIFTTDAKFLTMMSIEDFKSLKSEFPIIQEARYNYIDGFYREMLKEDFDLCVYSIEGDGDFLMLCEANDSSNAYVVNLAMTFCKVQFNKDSVNILHRYVRNVELYVNEIYDKYINVQAVYPSLNMVIFKYKEKMECVRTRIEQTGDGAKLILQDDIFAIKNPMKIKAPISKENKNDIVDNKKVEANANVEEVIYELSTVVDDKVYYGISQYQNEDKILNELLIQRDLALNNVHGKDKTNLSDVVSAMLNYEIGEFNVRIVMKAKFKDEKERAANIIRAIAKSDKEMLTLKQETIQKKIREKLNKR